jgi:hypothetical protein
MRRGPVTLAALLIVFLAGCSASVTLGHHSDTVDEVKLSKAITRRVREILPDRNVRGVTCPKGIKLAEGATFDCTADVEGAGSIALTVTLSNVNADDGSYDYHFDTKPTQP